MVVSKRRVKRSKLQVKMSNEIKKVQNFKYLENVLNADEIFDSKIQTRIRIVKELCQKRKQDKESG